MLIYSVTQVYVAKNEDAKKLTVHAAGLTATTGWTNPRLVPVEVSVPERPLDPAILQFNFEADRPKGATLQVLTPIQASLEITPKGPVDAVTVHAHANSVTVHVSSFAAPAAVSATAGGSQATGVYTTHLGPGEDPFTWPFEQNATTTSENLTMHRGEHPITLMAGEGTTFWFGEEGPGPFGGF